MTEGVRSRGGHVFEGEAENVLLILRRLRHPGRVANLTKQTGRSEAAFLKRTATAWSTSCQRSRISRPLADERTSSRRLSYQYESVRDPPHRGNVRSPCGL